MPPKTKSKRPAAVFDIPQNREAASETLRLIGEDQRELSRLEANMNDELATIKERYETLATPLRDRIGLRTQGLQTWCEANRATLTQGGRVKTAALAAGEVAWRTRPPSVRITGADAVMDILRRKGLGRFIRTKDEINKEAILAEPEAVSDVSGIAISQGEDFIATPFELALSEGAPQ